MRKGAVHHMKCMNCNQNEADRSFMVNWMGARYQMHICNECLEQMWNYAGAMGQQEVFRSFSGWWPGKESPRELGGSPFPPDAGAELKLRVRLAALRARLREAAEQENYEEAARLRDHLASLEKEAVSHES